MEYRLGQTWPAVKTRWIDFIKSSYWDNVLAIILEDLFPFLSIVLLVSESPPLQGVGQLWFYDGEHSRELTAKDEEMRVVLHVINPTVRLLHRSRKLSTRNTETSDINHYEPVQLDVDPKFHFPAIDQASLTELTGQ